MFLVWPGFIIILMTAGATTRIGGISPGNSITVTCVTADAGQEDAVIAWIIHAGMAER